MSVPYHKDRGKLRLTPGQVASYAKQAGFEDKDIPTIVGIATAESGLDPYNLNPNRKTGDESYGLMQINMIDYPDYQLGQERLKNYGLQSKDKLYDPLTNLKAARKIWDSQGPNAWSVYKSGAYKQYVPSQQELAQSAGVSAPPPVPKQDNKQPFQLGAILIPVQQTVTDKAKEATTFAQNFAKNLVDEAEKGTSTIRNRASKFLTNLYDAANFNPYGDYD